MSDSFSYNSVDMADYGLRLLTHQEPFAQETSVMQLVDRAYGLSSRRPAVEYSLDVKVHAADIATLKSYLDSIKEALNQRGDKQLTIDTFTDRYWLARFSGMTGSISTARIWAGTITFLTGDPHAYDNDETESGPHTVDEDPEEIIETPGGTEKTCAVFTLTCDDTLADTTVGIENLTTGQKIEWTGSLVADDVLEVDCVNKHIRLNGVDDMSTVSGPFPELWVGGNTLEVTGFSGTVTITYRERYA